MLRAVKIVCFALAVAGLGILAASCGNGNAAYRVVNAISNTTLLDPDGYLAVYMNGSSVFPQVYFPDTYPSGSYRHVGGGTDTIDVYGGSSVGVGGHLLFSSSQDLSGSTNYTVVLSGNQSTPPAVRSYTDDNTTTLPLSGNALFRVINASAVTGANGVDVYILPPGTTPTNPPTAPVFNSSALTYLNNDFTPYTNVGLPSGNSLNVYVTPHGERVNSGQPITVSGLTGGASIRTIVVMDTSPGVAPLQLQQLTDVN